MRLPDRLLRKVELSLMLKYSSETDEIGRKVMKMSAQLYTGYTG